MVFVGCALVALLQRQKARCELETCLNRCCLMSSPLCTGSLDAAAVASEQQLCEFSTLAMCSARRLLLLQDVVFDMAATFQAC